MTVKVDKIGHEGAPGQNFRCCIIAND
jgi:hypothetical protein